MGMSDISGFIYRISINLIWSTIDIFGDQKIDFDVIQRINETV